MASGFEENALQKMVSARGESVHQREASVSEENNLQREDSVSEESALQKVAFAKEENVPARAAIVAREAHQEVTPDQIHILSASHSLLQIPSSSTARLLFSTRSIAAVESATNCTSRSIPLTLNIARIDRLCQIPARF
jgi:hypothetical protein